jgi:branched-chain amino acid transport system substrate-binding protein
MRMQLMVEALVQAMEKSGTATNMVAVATQLENVAVSLSGQGGRMRAGDHQFQQALVVGVMDRQGTSGVKFDVEGSGYGFRVIRQISPAQAELPSTCRMVRPV